MERRLLLRAAGAAGAAVPLLVACGGDETSSPEAGGQDQEPNEDTTTEETPSNQASTPEDGPGSEGEGSSGGEQLAATGDIPVGGGKIFSDRQVVVTQPAEGDFKAFSSECTHKGCTVAEVAGGTINCGCHGSRFNVEDGSVANGPATRPLTAAKITVQGDAVILQS